MTLKADFKKKNYKNIYQENIWQKTAKENFQEESSLYFVLQIIH